MKTYRLGNAVVKVYRPDITATERSKRERNLAISLEQFGKAMFETQRRENYGNINSSGDFREQ